MYLSSYGAIFGVATVVAPVLGGALTTHVTWRACFLINIPFGVLSAVIVLLCFSDLRPDATHAHQTLLGKLKHLDFAGTVLILGHATCLLMALQISSTSQTWSDPQVIGLLVASLVLLCLFLLVQAYQKEIAILQLRVLRNRSIAGGALFLGTVGAAMNVFEYYVSMASPFENRLGLLCFLVTNMVSGRSRGLRFRLGCPDPADSCRLGTIFLRRKLWCYQNRLLCAFHARL